MVKNNPTKTSYGVKTAENKHLVKTKNVQHLNSLSTESHKLIDALLKNEEKIEELKAKHPKLTEKHEQTILKNVYKTKTHLLDELQEIFKEGTKKSWFKK
ncbi:MAG: hypothetical protein LBM76_00835 [Mycoplasmataceae bacterium]|jgi:hypothetical protein|nr:hypothetical protein [Mycoplasmataceae bacterium]